MNLNLFFLAIYSFIVTGASWRVIIIATPATQVLPNQTVMSPFKASQPFCVESKKGNSSILQRKLHHFHIRGKQSIVFKLIFIWSPSPEDDSNEPRNLKIINSPCFETKATNFNNITFYKKIGLFLYPDNLEIDTLKENLRNMLNMHKIHVGLRT